MHPCALADMWCVSLFNRLLSVYIELRCGQHTEQELRALWKKVATVIDDTYAHEGLRPHLPTNAIKPHILACHLVVRSARVPARSTEPCLARRT